METELKEPLLTTKDIGPFIRNRVGLPLTDKTIEAYCTPAIGKGPPVARRMGRIKLYDRTAVLKWAIGLTTPVEAA